jgi:PAS domain S-box-containing protein
MSVGIVATREASGPAATHRVLLVSLWGSIPVLAVVGLILDKPLYAAGLTSVLLAAFALGGMTNGTFAAVAVSLGLVAATGVLMAYADGSTFAHFVFFPAVCAVSFYRQWRPLAASIVGIVLYSVITMPVSQALALTAATGIMVLVLMAGWRLAEPDPIVSPPSGDRFRISFDEAPIGMAVLKPSGEILEVNTAMADLLGHSPDSLPTTNISRLVHADDHVELGEAWEEMGNSPTHRAIEWMRWITSNGQVTWGRVSLSLVPRTADQAALVILQLEDASRAYEEQRRLEELIRGKDEFVAAVGDEIRKPLGVLIDLTDRATHRHLDMSDTLPRIGAHAREIASIVDDLVLSARAETTPVAVVAHELDADVLCRDVLARTPGGHGVKLSFGAKRLWADPTLTRRIVATLVGNAIKYGGSEVKLETLASGPDTVIQVTDNGPELPALERDRVFSGDLRHGRPVTRPAAVGLSLTMGRHLARQMDGDLEYRRTSDGRNIFELRLPSEPFTEIPRPPTRAAAKT